MSQSLDAGGGEAEEADMRMMGYMSESLRGRMIEKHTEWRLIGLGGQEDDWTRSVTQL